MAVEGMEVDVADVKLHLVQVAITKCMAYVDMGTMQNFFRKGGGGGIPPFVRALSPAGYAQNAIPA